jgi:tetratricopeptide (TPR) repeat protein
VPQRNRLFTGREDVLDALRERLAGGGRVALSGLGGMGKTQTAIEYAHRHRNEYRAVFWVRAETRDELSSGFAALAGLLDLPERNQAERGVVLAAVRRWLEENAGWLLVLDNADDLGLARDFLPSGAGGYVLLTTRAQNTTPLAPRIRLLEMNDEVGARLLLRRADILKDDAPLETADEADRAAALVLSDEMDGLPLALDQAGAYIAATFSSPADYLDRYRRAGDRLRARRGADVPGEHDSVTRTFVLAFSRMSEPEHPDAPDDPETATAKRAGADLLRLCAFLDPDTIPEQIVIDGASDLGEGIGQTAADPLLYDAMMGQACRYSLLERDAKLRTLSIHRLVQDVLKDEMDEAMRRLWAERAVRALNRVFPDPEFSNWLDCERLLPHARESAKLIEERGMVFSEVGRLLNCIGCYLKERAQYADAEPLFQRALKIREQVLGLQHPDVATSLNNLATLYRAQGKYADSEPLYQRAAEIDRKALGENHSDYGTDLNNLAVLYHVQGKYADAEPLYQRALAIREQAFGPQHPSVATSLNNLATLYRVQGKHGDAESLYQRALAIWEQALGPQHPSVAGSLNNLAELYRAQHKYADAEPLLQRALAIREQALGPQHPDVATSLNNLARLYHDQDKYADAESLFQRSLAIVEQALGPQHPHVAIVLENYATLLSMTGRTVQATIMEERARGIQESHAK